MKKLTTILLICITTFAFSQEDNKVDKREKSDNNYNEIKINALFAVAGALEIIYERTLSETSAFGISAAIPFNERNVNDLEYYISPYYRVYFGKKYAKGFFLEGFGMLNSTRDNFLFFNEEEFTTDFALGIGVGGKWVTKSGFVGELNLGFGRNLFNSENSNYNVVGKLAVTVGYRF